jgi:hypothetical protein
MEDNGYCSRASRIVWSITIVASSSGAVNKNGAEMLVTEMPDYGRVGEYIRAKYNRKFVIDVPGRKSFECEKQAH